MVTSNRRSPTLNRPSCSAAPPEQISLTLSMLPFVPPIKAKPSPPPSGFLNSTCMMQLYREKKKIQNREFGEHWRWIVSRSRVFDASLFTYSLCQLTGAHHVLQKLSLCCEYDTTSRQSYHQTECSRTRTWSRIMLQFDSRNTWKDGLLKKHKRWKDDEGDNIKGAHEKQGATGKNEICSWTYILFLGERETSEPPNSRTHSFSWKTRRVIDEVASNVEKSCYCTHYNAFWK